MPRRIQQRHVQPVPHQLGLFGENRDSPLPLQREVVQKGILMVYPAKLTYPAAGIQKPLRQRSLPRVHMGQQTDTDTAFRFIFRFTFECSSHQKRSFLPFINNGTSTPAPLSRNGRPICPCAQQHSWYEWLGRSMPRIWTYLLYHDTPKKQIKSAKAF